MKHQKSPPQSPLHSEEEPRVYDGERVREDVRLRFALILELIDVYGLGDPSSTDPVDIIHERLLANLVMQYRPDIKALNLPADASVADMMRAIIDRYVPDTVLNDAPETDMEAVLLLLGVRLFKRVGRSELDAVRRMCHILGLNVDQDAESLRQKYLRLEGEQAPRERQFAEMLASLAEGFELESAQLVAAAISDLYEQVRSRGS